MSLIQWEPFTDAETVFNRLISGSLARWPRGLREGSGGKLEWAPSADISETDREYVIRAELPAVKKEDVYVTFDDGMITIKGERKQQKEDKSEKYHRIESFHGTFARSFRLPDDIDSASIKCENKDGVLTVRIPKAEAATTKPVQIKVQ